MQRRAAQAPGWGSSRVVPLATVREISARDIPRVLELYSANTEPWSGLPGTPPDDESRHAEWLQEMLHRGFNFIAEEEGCLVGHLILLRVGDTAQVSAFVHPDARRRGIGNNLLRVAVDQARDMGLRHVWIAIPTADRSLQDMLVHLGFSISSRAANHVDLMLTL